MALSPAQPVVGTAMTATLTDPDGSVAGVVWQWASSTDGSTGWTDISGATSATSASYTPATGDVGKHLRATATYTDGEGAGKSAQGVSANTVMAAAPVNQAPAFADDTAERTVAENTSAGENIGGPVMAADPDSGDTLTYSLSGVDAASFDIDAATGQLRTLAALDYESSTKSYSVTVGVSDGKDADGNADTEVDDPIEVTITVTNVDEQPALSGSSTVRYAENGTAPVASYIAADPEGVTVNWTLSGEDSDDFSISAGGALSFNASPDFVTPTDADSTNTYLVTVEATDGTTDKVTLAVTVTVTNVEEVGSAALSPPQPVVGVGVELTATLTDPDGSISAATWVWASSTDGSTGWTDISGATSASYTPAADDVGNYLRVSVTYTDGHSSGKSAQEVSANTVMAAAPVNQAPAFADDTATLEVAENTPAGENIGGPVTAATRTLATR